MTSLIIEPKLTSSRTPETLNWLFVCYCNSISEGVKMKPCHVKGNARETHFCYWVILCVPGNQVLFADSPLWYVSEEMELVGEAPEKALVLLIYWPLIDWPSHCITDLPKGAQTFLKEHRLKEVFQKEVLSTLARERNLSNHDKSIRARW